MSTDEPQSPAFPEWILPGFIGLILGLILGLSVLVIFEMNQPPFKSSPLPPPAEVKRRG